MDQGLSNNIVWSILQDSRGFMWFGTIDGLNRYDGYEAKVYRNDPDDPNSLSTNPLRVVHEDRAGNLWIGTSGGGLNRFDRETEQFTRYQHDPDDPNTLSGNDVRSIYEDQTGALWIGTTAGLNRLNLSEIEGSDPEMENGQAPRFTRFKHDPDDPQSLSHDFVQSVIQDRDGLLWIGSWGGGLDRLDPQTGQFNHYRHDPNNPTSLSNNFVWVVFKDEMGTLWVGTNAGLNKLDRESEAEGQVRFVRFQYDPNDPSSLSEDTIRSVYEDQAGNLWVGTFEGGLNWLDRAAGTFVRYQHNPTDPSSLSDNDVISIQEDQAGTLWIGTAGGGVNIVDANRKPFAHFHHNPGAPHSLSSNAVRAIHEDRSGVLWIGTEGGGLNQFDRDRGTFVHYRHDPDNPHSLSDNFVWSIAEDPGGVLWIGTEAGGLNRLDPKSASQLGAAQFDHYRHDPSDPSSLGGDSIRSILADQSGDVWLGTRGNGLDRFDPETETSTHYLHDPNDPDSLSNNAVRVLYQDSGGNLWIGTIGGGLDRFDRATQKFAHYQHDPSDPSSLSDNSVRAILEDRAGNLWVGTWGGGLNKLDRTHGTFTHYSEKDGLANNVIWGMLEDNVPPEEGGPSLWISTNQGLSRFDLEAETFRNYDAADGLQSNSFYSAQGTDSNGVLYFGGANGFNAFNPQELQDNPHPPPVVLVDFQLGNRPVPIEGNSVLQKSIVETDELVLSYKDRVATFKFAALNYSSSEKNRYRYTLEGFDDGWAEVGSDRRLATYTNLDPGEYMFRVIGSNNDGIWNEEGVAIRLTVTPPWWATWWFRGGMLLLVVAAAFAGYRWQIRSIEARSRELEGQVAVKTEILNDQVKELDCLYGISRLAGRQGISLEEVLQGAVELIPQTLKHPEIACARIVLAEQEYRTENFQETAWQQTTAIRAHDEQAGMIQICYLEESPGGDEGPFLKEEHALLDVIAERLGRIAERLHAEYELRRTRDELSTLLAVSQDVVSTLDLDLLLGLIMNQLKKVVDFDAVSIHLLVGNVLELRAFQFARVIGVAPPQRLLYDEMPVFREMIASLKGFVLVDLQREPGLMSAIIDNSDEGFTDIPPSVRSFMAAPLAVRSTGIGMLAVSSASQNVYDQESLNLLQAFANQAAVAVENAQLYAKAQETATLEERTRLARELHDSATQALYSAMLFSETARKLTTAGDLQSAQHYQDRVSQVVQQALKEMRLLVYELRPPELETEGLVSALQLRLDAVENRVGMEARLSAGELPALPPEVTESLYRIALEALNNALKHAQADAIAVNLHSEGKVVSLEVADNGQGFDPNTVQGGGGMGLIGIQERVDRMEGELIIDSAPDRGTSLRVSVEVPQ
jgi:signal transduction histidine kinase/ligand-binding sensor domain-containing protein